MYLRNELEKFLVGVQFCTSNNYSISMSSELQFLIYNFRFSDARACHSFTITAQLIITRPRHTLNLNNKSVELHGTKSWGPLDSETTRSCRERRYRREIGRSILCTTLRPVTISVGHGGMYVLSVHAMNASRVLRQLPCN